MTLALACLISACAGAPPAREPMATIARPAERASDTLVVMLPGRGDRGPDFVAERFLDIGDGHGFDMIAADAHFGYYIGRSMVERLRADVIEPARERGYERIWLLGISAGGLGANLYARAHPEHIDGLILLAPYPGDEALVASIKEAGGLRAWSGETTLGRDFERKTWRWLKQATADPGAPRIVLGYGRGDRFARAAALLGEALPPERVFTVDGGHRWPVWRALWRDILAADMIGSGAR